MNQLTIIVLGGLNLELARAHTAFDLPTRKSKAFLAYLALSPGMTRSREHLAATFWDRSAEEQARASLRQALSTLRKHLSNAHALIRADSDRVWLDAPAVGVDALQFARFVQEGSPESLEAATALYRGELLSGFSLREERFEQWMSAERRLFHDRAVQALCDLVGHYAERDYLNRGIAVAERLLALDPLLEWAHCALIRLYLRAGRREAALRQYRECTRILSHELGIAPGEETRELAAEVGRTSVVRSAPRGFAACSSTWRSHESAIAVPEARAPSARPAERKQLTVLCARIHEEIDNSDPEATLQRLDPIFSAISNTAEHFGGTISHIGCDGVTALFGAPTAQEDHAVRACYAALAMRDAISALAHCSSDVRIGIHSGEAVVRILGDERSQRYDAVGSVPRLAHHIDAALAAGQIGVTAEVARRAEGFVQLQGPFSKSLEEVSAPVALFMLHAKAPVRLRWEARSTRELTQFIGRAAEISNLSELLKRAAQDSTGQVTAIVGEPGMGKSRLVHEFVSSPRVSGCTVLETGTTSHETSATYLAIACLLRAWFGIRDRDTQAQAAQKLSRGIDALDQALAHCVPPLAALLDLPPRDPRWATLSPPQKRQRTLEAVKMLVIRQSQVQPLILVVEDLHWSDPGTQAVLDHLVNSLAACRVLLLLTHRPEYRHEWLTKSHFTQLRLKPLGVDNADQLLRALLGDDRDLEALRKQLIARTAGTPLFIEESVRALVETGALTGRPGAYRQIRPIETIEIPSTVHAVLAARIDRLPALEKSVLQTAAVIGQEVPSELLQAIAEIDPEPLHELLAQLQAAEFLYQSRLPPTAQYTFKHALTHGVAYDSVLKERRRAVHGQLISIIEARYADRLDEHVERLAHHALGAEQWPKAVHYLQRSASKAIQRSAHQQAIRYLNRGLELISALPDSAERRKRELDYQKALGVTMMAAKGFAAKAVLDAYTRAQALSEELGDKGELFLALRCEGQYRMIGGESEIARKLADRCTALAAASEDIGVRIEAHHMSWSNSLFLGEYTEAAFHSAKGIALYQRERDHALTYMYSGHDPGVCGRGFSAMVQCLCGHPDSALAMCRETMELADQLKHPLTTAIGSGCCSLVHMFRSEPLPAKYWAEREIAVCEEYQLPLFRFQGIIYLGWALAQRGDVEAGIECMREGIAGTSATGADMGLSYFIALLGEALGKAGQIDAGLAEIEKALARSKRGGSRFQISEILRVKGELLKMLSKSHWPEAESCFRQAIAAADQQDAKLLKLRSAMGLARLLADAGAVVEARAVLQPAYEAMTEGRDIVKLREASALLAAWGNR